MIRVSVLYPQKDGARFEWAYYLDAHLPLVGRTLGPALKGVSVEQGLAGGAPGSPATYVALCHLSFESVPAFQAAFAQHGGSLMADIPNYTSIEPIIQISEVKMTS